MRVSIRWGSSCLLVDYFVVLTDWELLGTYCTTTLPTLARSMTRGKFPWITLQRSNIVGFEKKIFKITLFTISVLLINENLQKNLPYFWNEKTKIVFWLYFNIFCIGTFTNHLYVNINQRSARKKSIYFFKSDSSIPWTLETSISLPIGSCLARATTFFPPSISRLP